MSSSKQAKRPAVLLVDDDEAAAKALKAALLRRSNELSVAVVHSAADALRRVTADHPEAAVVDLSIDPDTGPASGLELIQRLVDADPTLRILVLTGHGGEEFGVRSLRQGAASFLQKPADPDHLLALLRDAVSYSALKRRMFRFTTISEKLTALTGLTTRSETMTPVLEAVAFAASNRQPVLLVGETGVGKGLIAHAIHRAGTNPAAPFIRFQPRFGTPDLVSSELFGHHKGAFTGAHEARRGLIEDAHLGTLFIDEVDELPVETQISLLNVIQEKVFRRLGSNRDIKSDFRLIAATNQPIETSLKKSKLRQDFFHRIAHFVIEIPPLRERIEDIRDLSELFLSQLVTRERLPVQGISPEAVTKLCNYSWPGNVRELQAAVESAVYQANFHGRRLVEVSDIKLKKSAAGKTSTRSFRAQIEEFERKLIEDALAKTGNNHSKAAELLQLDRSTMRRILGRRNDS